MPSTMIHLLAAYELEPAGTGLFWVGNFAPDYASDRVLKDKIHLRDTEDRIGALRTLYQSIDKNNDFERGWFFHLFTDACWDESVFLECRDYFISLGNEENWFSQYRNEIGLASYYLYHSLPWAKEMWQVIADTQLDKIETSLLITPVENSGYRDRVCARHIESPPDIPPKFLLDEKITAFVDAVIDKYKKWTF